jgi:hypothetical protein
MLTGATPDCRPRHGRTSPALSWSVVAITPYRRGRGKQVRATTGFLMKILQNGYQNVIFDVTSEVHKDLEDVSAGTGNFLKNLIHKNFARNKMSNFARSIGTIIVKDASSLYTVLTTDRFVPLYSLVLILWVWRPFSS